MGKNKRKRIKDEIDTEPKVETLMVPKDNNDYDDKFKKKKKKKLESDIKFDAEIDDSKMNEDLDDLDIEEVELEDDETEQNGDINEDVDIKWNSDEMKTLLLNIQKCLPKNDLSKYSTTLEKSIDWEQVKFNNRDSKECKACALMIMKKVRRFRTLTEMLVDAFEWIESPWKSLVTKRIRHPDLPKKPMSAYLRYFQEKRPKLLAQNPSLSMVELAKLVAEKFTALSEKKKAKYKKEYEKELIDYRQKLIKFKEEHPDIYKNRPQRSRALEQIGPEKPRTPFQLYKQSKMKKLSSNDGDDDEDPKIILDRIRESWNNISDNKRYKFIKKSLKDQERYKTELEEFIRINPNYEPSKLKPLLTKSEMELKNRFQGMPERPPNSGYMLFSQIMLKEVKDVPAKEKMVLIAKRWKEMTDQERAKYNEDAQSMMNEYVVKFDEYLQHLPEEEKEKVILEQRFKLPSEKKIRQKIPTATAHKNRQDKTAVENTAMIAYQMEEMNKLQTKYPHKPKSQIMEMINSEWTKMNVEQKSKYINLAESIQDYIPKPLTKANKNNQTNKMTKFKDEKEAEFFEKTGFKKPRPTGFVIFCHRILSTKNDLATRDRLKFASERWKEIPEDVKKLYNNLARNKFDRYNQLLEKYKKTGELPNEKDKEILENFSIEDAEYEEEEASNKKNNRIEEKCDKQKKTIAKKSPILSLSSPSLPKKQSSNDKSIKGIKSEPESEENMELKRKNKNKTMTSNSWSNVMYDDSESLSSLSSFSND